MGKFSTQNNQLGYSIEDQKEENNLIGESDKTFKLLKILKSPTDELLQILNNNVIGTPGRSMLYQHLGVNKKIDLIANPYFVNLVKDGKIIGTCCFCKRTTTNNDYKIQAFYVRYFSFKDAYRRKTATEKRPGRTGTVRREIESLLSGNGLEINSSEKFFHYAYVDPRNTRSVLLCKEFGFESIRQYTIIVFNRLVPKYDENFQILETTSKDEKISQLLNEFYKGLNTFSTENLSDERKYYFVKDEHDQVVAGVQANPDRWKIFSLPGITGKLLLNTFTHIPILNRLFNKTYDFLALDGIYYVRGSENILEKLLESLLRKFNVNSAIAVVDPESHLYTTLKSLRLGLVDKLNKEVRGDVICRFSNLSEEEKQQFRSKPAYISGIDVT